MILNFEYLGENETKFKNILTHWSVAQANSNEEKTRGQKSRWTVPLKQFTHLKKKGTNFRICHFLGHFLLMLIQINFCRNE